MKDLARLLSLPVVEAARRLLGWRLRTEFGGEATELALTEVEAYAGPDDPASHAFRGPTSRNQSMFKAPGTLYVYRSYGVHWCANVVTGPPGRGNAVLLRGGIPLLGAEVMQRRRGGARRLAVGPGNLTAALGITGEQDGSSLFEGPVRLLPGPPPKLMGTTRRVGLTKASDFPWRFVAGTPRRT